jgi:hypothetical protein
MKRGINTLLWLYFSLVMQLEMMKNSIGCEGIRCGEREDIYPFTCELWWNSHLVNHCQHFVQWLLTAYLMKSFFLHYGL